MAYKFLLIQSGTYWMHSHYGLQEELLNAAPLIIEGPEEKEKAEQQLVVILSDFSFEPPEQILNKLKSGTETCRRWESRPAHPKRMACL